MHSSIKFTNNADTFLTEAIITTTTVLPVIEKSTAVFPKIDVSKDQYFMLLLVDAEDNNKTEYLKCVDYTDSTFTVIRAQEGTEALNFPSNSRVLHIASAQSLQDIQDQSRIVRTHAVDTPVYGAGTAQEYGHVKLTDNFELGTQAINGIACSPKALRMAIARLIALPKERLFTASTTWTCPESGLYMITCVGGGGTGGTGGYADYDGIMVAKDCGDNPWSDVYALVAGGGGGGGGGAGQTVTQAIQCTKGTVYGVVVAAPAGTSVFGSNLIVGLPGGTGGTGGNGTATASKYGYCPEHGKPAALSGGVGGNLGTNYGTNGSMGNRGPTYESEGSWPCGNNFASGGAGAISTFGSGFGTGGTGGRGGGQADHYRCYLNIAGPAGGSAGTQGCIKIVYPLGK